MSMRFVAVAAAALSLACVAGRAQADPTPSPTTSPVALPTVAPSAKLDPYAKTAIDILTNIVNQQITNFRNSASGQVTYFKRFDMQIATGRNAYRAVRLHQGTVINPRGESITVGQQVDVTGTVASDGSIDANVITIKQ